MYTHIIFLHNECYVKVKVLVTQLCPTLCNPIYCSLPSSSVHGILQARYWSGLPFPSPGDLPDPGIDPWSPALQADFFTIWVIREARVLWNLLASKSEGAGYTWNSHLVSVRMPHCRISEPKAFSVPFRELSIVGYLSPWPPFLR